MAGGDGGKRNELECSTDDLKDEPGGSRSATATGFDRRHRSVPSHASGRRAAAPAAWCFGDPDVERRRRVAGYKAYSVEGKVKASLRKGFRWVKGRCSELISGW